MAEVYPFDRILLEPEQKDLLITLVEADRSVPRNKRKKIQVWTTEGDDEVYTSLRHPGLTNSPSVFQGDIDALARVGLLDPSYESSSLTEYTITPRGYAYYRYLIEQTAEPTQRVDERVRHYFDADRFRRAYPSVLQKWAHAETLLWSAESELQLTTIGHLCREAMQTFATVLVERYRPDGVDQNQASTVGQKS
jgi:hypothetical protein